jgi:C-terminal processing protease CtpA/Prc
MIDPTNVNPPSTPEPVLRPEARIVRADRSLATMVLFVCTLGGMGIGFGSAMYLMRAHWGAPGAYYHHCGSRAVLSVPSQVTYLGVNIVSTRAQDGAVIVRVFDNTGADRAGLARGDIIRSLDGGDIDGSEELVRAVRSRSPGDLVQLGIERGGEPVTVHARLGRL